MSGNDRSSHLAPVIAAMVVGVVLCILIVLLIIILVWYQRSRRKEKIAEGICHHILNLLHIKTHGSESRGQERAKRITKNKTHDKLLCAFYTSECFRNMMS